MPKVGLFFYVNGNLLIDLVEVDQAEIYGVNKIGRSSHDGIWEEKYNKVYDGI